MFLAEGPGDWALNSVGGMLGGFHFTWVELGYTSCSSDFYSKVSTFKEKKNEHLNKGE